MPQISLEQDLQQHLGLESIQGISLLTMNSLELGEYLRDQALSNPFLQIKESEHSLHARSEMRSRHVSTERLIERTTPHNGSASHSAGGAYGEIKREYPFEKHLICKPTLAEHLESLAAEVASEEDMQLFYQLIGNIDAHGYLRASTAEIAAQCKVTKEHIDLALARLQKILPAGIGARNLSECLLLQLEAKGINNSLVTRIVSRHLEDLSRGRIKQVAQACGTTAEEVQDVIELIRSLNPRPASQFSTEEEPCIWPELELYCEEQNCFSVRQVDSLLPSLRIDDTYLALLNSTELPVKTKSYLVENFKLAQNLFSAIEQRKKTILNVAGAIMYCQQDFCTGGFLSIKPLTMSQVASLAQVHESTVSRVVNNTYMQTPHGLIELRRFFSAGIKKEDGASCSAACIKQHLSRLVSEEDSKHPLSDQQLAEKLAAIVKVTISRRTINKYRTALNIPTHSQRRTY